MSHRLSEESAPHRLLAELRAAERRLDRVCELAHIGVIEVDDPFTPQWVVWSETAYEIFARAPHEAPLSLASMCEELVHPEDRESVYAALEEAVATEGATSADFRIRRGDGTWGFLEGRFRPERVDGDPLRWIAVLRDVTEQRRLEHDLRHAQKMEAIARLTAGIAHEYNNLLMGIQGCTRLAMRRLDATDPAMELMRAASQAADRGEQLTRQLLDFGARREPARGAVHLDAVIERTSRMLRVLLGERITLSVHLGAPTWRLFGDEGEIEQVLVNLALNARDAMPHGGVLEITTGQGRSDAAPLAGLGMNLVPGDYLWLRVADQGVGMDETTRERAFEPFFTTKGTGEGTGLGLSTVYGIARAGGGIALRSEPGAGTTFVLAFARVDHPESLAAAPSSTRGDPRSGHERLLIVEDEELIRLTLRGYLVPRGYQVDEACDLFEASLLLSREDSLYDLVISDVMLPGGSGREVHAQLLLTQPDVPIIFMSAYPRDILVATDRIPADAALLQKPFDETQLMQAIRATLGPSRQSMPPPVSP